MSDVQYYIDRLVDILDSADIPWETSYSPTQKEFPAKDGWKVGVHYHCGDFRHIDYMISPGGLMINPWWDHVTAKMNDAEREAHKEIWAPILQWQPREQTQTP
jgi:hypothetical protein